MDVDKDQVHSATIINGQVAKDAGGENGKQLITFAPIEKRDWTWTKQRRERERERGYFFLSPLFYIIVMIFLLFNIKKVFLNNIIIDNFNIF